MIKDKKYFGKLLWCFELILLFFLYILIENEKIELAGIVGFLSAFFCAFWYPWTCRRNLFWTFSKNPNRSSYYDRVQRSRFLPFTTSKQGRMFGMWIGGTIIMIIFVIIFYFLANNEKDRAVMNIITMFIVGGYLGWGIGLLRDYLAYKKLPKGTTYQN